MTRDMVCTASRATALALALAATLGLGACAQPGGGKRAELAAMSCRQLAERLERTRQDDDGAAARVAMGLGEMALDLATALAAPWTVAQDEPEPAVRLDPDERRAGRLERAYEAKDCAG